jgi:hypothetical protein
LRAFGWLFMRGTCAVCTDEGKQGDGEDCEVHRTVVAIGLPFSSAFLLQRGMTVIHNSRRTQHKRTTLH